MSEISEDRAAILGHDPELLALAAMWDAGRRPGQATLGRIGRPKKAPAVKRVIGHGGYKTYTTVDWEKAAKQRAASMSDKPGLIVSKGRRG